MVRAQFVETFGGDIVDIGTGQKREGTTSEWDYNTQTETCGTRGSMTNSTHKR